MSLKDLSGTGSRQALWLTESEEALVKDILACLDAGYSAEAEIVKERFDCLKSFGTVIALFPPIREAQSLLGSVRDDSQLVKSLTGLSPSSHLLHIPARILAVRSFLVTKFHAFSLLAKLVSADSPFWNPLHKALFQVMFTIMAEDVYFSCLDEPTFPVHMKVSIANDLISLWDSGSELAMAGHLPALEALWIARNDSPPSFGTLEGTSEILRISLDMGEDWHDFLVDQLKEDETRWALEEFIFGLSHEELHSVRLRLRRFGISAVNFDEIHSFLGNNPAYSMARNDDPRALYDFFIERKEAAQFRLRMRGPGPFKTLEEIYLKYRMNFWV